MQEIRRGNIVIQKEEDITFLKDTQDLKKKFDEINKKFDEIGLKLKGIYREIEILKNFLPKTETRQVK